MSKSPRRLSEAVNTSPVPEGFNDGRWFLLEHQLHQFRISIQQVRELARQIGECPENAEEAELAQAVYDMLQPLHIEAMRALANIHSLLSGTEVAERISEREE